MVKARARTQKMALSQKATPQSFLRYGDHFLKTCELLLDQEDPHNDLLFVNIIWQAIPWNRY
ncbi:hypothetical protein M7784_10295 [Desulfovibrio aminophilus]|nr:hypothetical protein [Desulfovibrio aminophilus]MCM0755633.1 hypothetical protein [Desulfovibrio aminophilus]